MVGRKLGPVRILLFVSGREFGSDRVLAPCARRKFGPDRIWESSGVLLLLDLGPGVAQRDRTVEHELSRRRIAIDAEVAEALELIARAGLRRRERRLELAAV